MAVNPAMAHGSNTYIANTDATNGLVVDYSRNVRDFMLPNYVQYTPINKERGLYVRMTVEVAGRLHGDNVPDENYWADGKPAPEFDDGRESFGFHQVTAKRYAYGFTLGELAVEQADFAILGPHMARHAQKAMTARTMKVHDILTTTANWATDHTISNPESISGVTGRLDLSTTARKDIKKTFDYMFDQVRLHTLGAVKASQVQIVVSPYFARTISACQEIVDHIKQSPVAREELENGLAPNTRYGLPSTLYGYPLVIEDAVKITSKRGASSTTYANVWGNGDVVMVSRPGALEGVEGAPSFSTVQLFLKEDMTVQTKHDVDNRRHLGRIVDHYVPEITSPISGFYLQNALSA